MGYNFNWKEERLEVAKELGYSSIEEAIIETYKKTKSLKETGKICCHRTGSISDMSISRFLKFAGIPREPRGFIRYKKFVEHNGHKFNLKELAEIAGVSRNCIYKRLYYYNFSLEEALTTPLLIGNRHARKNKISKSQFIDFANKKTEL